MAPCVHVMLKRCCFDPAVDQKKETSLLLSLAALTEYQGNKPPADTTAWSAKEETTTYLHFYPSKNGPSVPKAPEEADSIPLVGIK